MSKRRVWLCQSNTLFGRACFLPYSCGVVWSYANSLPQIKENYELAGFSFTRNPVEEEINRIGKVDVFGASLYTWNNSYTHALMRAVREANPNCLIVVGGPYVPDKSDGYLERCPYIDYLVHGEGEETFAELLMGWGDLVFPVDKIKGISYREDGKTVRTQPRPRADDLDKIPSPYLTGVFDELMRSPYDFHASQETHRGCPFRVHDVRLGKRHVSKSQTVWGRAVDRRVRMVCPA